MNGQKMPKIVKEIFMELAVLEVYEQNSLDTDNVSLRH